MNLPKNQAIVDEASLNQEQVYNDFIGQLQPGSKWNSQTTNAYLDQSEIIWDKQKQVIINYIDSVCAKISTQIDQKVT